MQVDRSRRGERSTPATKTTPCLRLKSGVRRRQDDGWRRTVTHIHTQVEWRFSRSFNLRFLFVGHGRGSWKFYDEASDGGNAEPNAKAPGKIKSTALIGATLAGGQSGPEATNGDTCEGP